MAHSSYPFSIKKTENRTRGILSWPIAERPRERLLERGANALSTRELLAILIGTGVGKFSAVDLAERVVGLGENVAERSVGELVRVQGLGFAKAARIVAAYELGRRGQEIPKIDKPRLTSPDEVVRFLRPRFGGLTEEIFLVVSVDVKNRPIAVHEIARGSGESVSFKPREVFEEAIKIGASGIVVAHNHPSGDPTPSGDDERLTVRLKEGAELLGLRFLDHVIIAEERYFAFATQRTEAMS